MNSSRRFCLLALLVGAAATFASARTLVYAGALIDGLATAPKKEMTIVVDGDRIVAVQPGYTAPATEDKVIDLKSATVMPGWIDCHVHLDFVQSPATYTERFTMNPGDYALRAAFNARKTLLAGFTTVRNVGDAANSTIALRNAIAARCVVGPRIYTAGRTIATTGGHADGSNGASVKLMGDPGPLDGVINGADERPRPARRRHQRRRRGPQGRPPALQGGRGPDQDHRHRRRARPAGQRPEPAVP